MAFPPFLEQLDAEARGLLLGAARAVSYRAGETMVRHGQAARGAYVLKGGAAEASVVLPGGERLVVATLGAGAMFGETALVERATASATVRAISDVEGWVVERESFRALILQRSSAALRLQHAVIQLLCGKLAALNTRVLECRAPEDRPARAAHPGDPLDGVERKWGIFFDPRPFFPKLAVFADFDEDEIADAVAGVPFVELPRGHPVFFAGHPAHACYLVLRGALEVWGAAEGRERRLALAGPGQLVGYMSLVAGAPQHSASAFAREDSILLEYDAARFRALYQGSDDVSLKLNRALLGALLASMKRTNIQLTRLISAARLRGAHGEGDALEAARSSQIVAAEPTPEP